jgi:hypothetical protein
MNLFKRIRLLQTVRNVIIQSAAVVAPPGLKLCNPYFFISETNGRNASMNNSLIRVFNVKREITLSTFLSWDTQLQLSICLLLFLYCYFTLYIVVLTLKIDHCLVFISIKLSYLILSYLTSVWKWSILLSQFKTILTLS